MDRVEAVAQATKALHELLASDDLAPDPKRRDWDAHRARLMEVARAAKETVLGPLEEACAELEAADQQRLRNVCAGAAGSAAALLVASGDAPGGMDLLGRARRAAGEGPAKAELEAAGRAPESYVELALARWYWRRGKASRAERLFERVARSSPEAALKQAAGAQLDQPRPITRAPSLFTINGFGVRLIGHADPRPDGTYVATTTLTALFIPLFPLSSYRVIRRDTGWGFLGKVPLRRGWRLWRSAVLGISALAVVGFGTQSYLESPGRQASLAVARAAALEKAGKSGEAIAAYDAAIRAWSAEAPSELTPAAEGWVRLRAAAIAEPFTRAQTNAATRLVRRFQELPAPATRGATRLLLEKLHGWQDRLGTSDPADAEAALALCELGAGVAGGADRDRLIREEANLHVTLARALARDWPLDALSHAVTAGTDPDALAVGAEILDGLNSDSLFAEGADDIRQWAERAQKEPRREVAARAALARLARAVQAEEEPSRQKLLEASDPAALAAALRKDPADQHVAVTLAAVQRAHGKLPEAIALLESFGSPGRLIHDGQRLLAYCLSESGRAERAEQILERYLARRLPRFQEARRAFEQGLDRTQDRLIGQARAGQLPPELEHQIEAAPEAKKRALFSEWLNEQLGKDAELERLQGERQKYHDVVDASLSLGMAKLQRANSATGDEREALLGDAERIFLAIRQDAEDSPTFHLGLGQVYHRLGKAEEGDRELQSLLEKPELTLHLEVAAAYREVGLVSKAREIMKQVFARGDAATADAAAMSLVATANDVREKEHWLSQVKSESPQQRAGLAEVRGQLRVEEGKPEEADREFAAAAAIWEKINGDNGANNGALCWLSRFECTGNPAYLDKAVELFERASRLTPDNSIVVSNIATALEARASLAVLEPWLPPRLPLRTGDGPALLSALMRGEEQTDAAARLKTVPAFRRAQDFTRREEVLAPRSPDGFERERRWFLWTRDRPGLAQLTERAARISSFDLAYRREWLAAYQRGERDEQVRAACRAQLVQLDARLARLPSAAPGSTRALLELLRARELSTLASLDTDLALAGQAVDANRRAMDLWPASGADASLVTALFARAVLQAAKDEPTLAAAWKKDGRIWGKELLVFHAARTTPATLQYFRARPEIREAAQLLHRRLDDPRLDLEDWTVGWLADDGDLQRAAATALRSGIAKDYQALLAKIEVGTPEAEERAELLRTAAP